MALKCYWPVYHFTNGIKEVIIEPADWGRVNVSQYPGSGDERSDRAAKDYLICCDEEELRNFETRISCRLINGFFFPSEPSETSVTQAIVSERMQRALQQKIGAAIQGFSLTKITYKNLDTESSKKRCEYCTSEKTGKELERFNNFKNEFWSLFCGGPQPEVPTSPSQPQPPAVTPDVSPVPPPKPPEQIKKIPIAQIQLVAPCPPENKNILIESTEQKDLRFLVDIEALKVALSNVFITNQNLYKTQVLDENNKIKNLNFKLLKEEYLSKTGFAVRSYYSFPNNGALNIDKEDPKSKIVLNTTDKDIKNISFPKQAAAAPGEGGDMPIDLAQYIKVDLIEPNPASSINKRLIFGAQSAEYQLPLLDGTVHGVNNSYYTIKLENNFYVNIPVKFSLKLTPQLEGALTFILKCKSGDKETQEGDACWEKYNTYQNKTKTIEFSSKKVSSTTIDITTNILIEYILNDIVDGELRVNIPNSNKKTYSYPNFKTGKFNHDNTPGKGVPVGLIVLPDSLSIDVANQILLSLDRSLDRSYRPAKLLQNGNTKTIITKGNDNGLDGIINAPPGSQVRTGSKIKFDTDTSGFYYTNFTNGTQTISDQLKTNLRNKDKFTINIKNEKKSQFIPIDSTILFDTILEDSVIQEIKTLLETKETIPQHDACCCCYWEVDPAQISIKFGFVAETP